MLAEMIVSAATLVGERRIMRMHPSTIRRAYWQATRSLFYKIVKFNVEGVLSSDKETRSERETEEIRRVV